MSSVVYLSLSTCILSFPALFLVCSVFSHARLSSHHFPFIPCYLSLARRSSSATMTQHGDSPMVIRASLSVLHVIGPIPGRYSNLCLFLFKQACTHAGILTHMHTPTIHTYPHTQKHTVELLAHEPVLLVADVRTPSPAAFPVLHAPRCRHLYPRQGAFPSPTVISSPCFYYLFQCIHNVATSLLF